MKWAALLIVCLPLNRLQVTSPFGYRNHPLTRVYSFHNGVDLRAQSDTVYAVSAGKVMRTGFDRKLGLYITLEHPGFQSCYGHLSQVFVGAADGVLAGQPIGITGRTGQVTAEHLHFSISSGNSYTDPLEFIYAILTVQHHE